MVGYSQAPPGGDRAAGAAHMRPRQNERHLVEDRVVHGHLAVEASQGIAFTLDLETVDCAIDER